MMPGDRKKATTKKRVNSVMTSIKKEQPTKNNASAYVSFAGEPKGRRDKRIESAKMGTSSNRTKKENKTVVESRKIMKDQWKEVKQPGQQSVVQQQKLQTHHFMTVADLTAAEFQPSPGHRLQTPVNQYKEQSTIKGGSVQKYSPQQTEKQLDQTIGKLRSKRDTIDILNRTIQTRLAQASRSPTKIHLANRIDVYEVEMNYYVEKISQMQKELYQKNKKLAILLDRQTQQDIVSKNNRRLLADNHRLRDQNVLLERENQALKKLLLKRTESKL